jgi:DNA-binding response OmpR family regulator
MSGLSRQADWQCHAVYASFGLVLSLAPRPLRIVIVDDEPDTVLMLGAILKHEGHEVFGASSGREGLALARHNSAHALIVDIQLPDMSGYEIARRVRDSYPSERPLLIAISGRWKGQTDRLLSVVVGFDHHLIKPCDPADLVKVLKDWSTSKAPGPS